MKMLKVIGVAVLAGSCLGAGFVRAQDDVLYFDIGNAITGGKFTYSDATIDVGTEVFNPRLLAEARLGSLPFGLGAEFAMSGNEFDGEYDGSDGSVEVERTEMGLYIRMGSPTATNFKIGYKNFKYDMSKGDITKREGGRVTERDTNGKATGDLTKGIDAELTLAAGHDLQFALGIGLSYFMDAEYSWSYFAAGGSKPGFNSGSATLDAVSVRLRPEISLAISEQLRVYANVTIQASSWTGDLPDDDVDYPGVDIYSALTGGIRYTFGL